VPLYGYKVLELNAVTVGGFFWFSEAFFVYTFGV
jgi:hypothetical protein